MNLRIQDNFYLLSMFFILTIMLNAAFFAREMRNVQSNTVNSWFQEQSADCAVVLTGGPGRIKEGIDLLATRSVQKLIISGVFKKSDLQDIFSESPYFASVDSNDIILEKFSRTTFSNALETQSLVQGLQCRNLILITSQVHMYRAYKTFESLFPRNFSIVKHAVSGGAYEPGWIDILEETAKSLFYSCWVY